VTQPELLDFLLNTESLLSVLRSQAESTKGASSPTLKLMLPDIEAQLLKTKEAIAFFRNTANRMKTERFFEDEMLRWGEQERSQAQLLGLGRAGASPVPTEEQKAFSRQLDEMIENARRPALQLPDR
jgi:hypothetical protein